jgi:hypothetical protein
MPAAQAGMPIPGPGCDAGRQARAEITDGAQDQAGPPGQAARVAPLLKALASLGALIGDPPQ